MDTRHLVIALLCATLVACTGERTPTNDASDAADTAVLDTTEADAQDTSGDTSQDTASDAPTDAPSDTRADGAGDTAEDAPEDSALPDTIPFDAYPTYFSEAFCELLTTCATPEIAFIQLYFNSQDVCVDGYGEVTGKLLDEMRPLVDDGSIIYDPAAARACVDTIRGLPCGLLLIAFNESPFSACKNVFKGTATVGETCHRSEECAGDNFCDHTSATGGLLCPGQCRSRLNLGQECSTGKQCTATTLRPSTCVTSTLSDGTTSRICLEPRLATELHPDGLCGGVPEPDNGLIRFYGCPEGLTCNDSTEGTCVVPNAEGESCEQESVCDDDLLCAYAADQTRTCERFQVQNAVGDPCDGPLFGISGGRICNQFLGLQCTNGTCVEAGDGTLGSACDSDGFNIGRCDRGLYCDSVSDACLALKDADEACSRDEACKSGTCYRQTCTRFSCDY